MKTFLKAFIQTIFCIILTVVASTLILSESHANTLEGPSAKSKKYLVVAIAGFKTGRDNPEDIMSSKIGKGSEVSGVWSYLEKNYHHRIFETVYLTHYSKDSELNSVLKLLEDKNGLCRKDLGMIFMVNSWGAKISQKLARQYFLKCQTLPHLTIMIEGVSKPTPLPYTKSILAFNCVNFYQLQSSLHGAPIANCHNILMPSDGSGSEVFMNHIRVEWYASDKGRTLINEFLNDKLGLTFVRELYDVDFTTDLEGL